MRTKSTVAKSPRQPRQPRQPKGTARMLRLTAPIANSDLAAARALLHDITPELRETGADWYPLVHDRCVAWSCESGYSIEQCAAVLALYSINSTWSQNVKSARRALFDGQVKGMPIIVGHVTAILASCPIEDHLTKGSKVQNFYRSIMLQESCTCDRWMFRLFDRPQGEDWYGWVARCVQSLAQEEDMPTATMQATLWMAITARDGVKYSDYRPQHKEKAA